MYKALYLSPMIPSYNVKETLNFFVAIFGFKAVMDTGGYALVVKDNHLIDILNAGADIGEMEFYLEVDEIDNLAYCQNKLRISNDLDTFYWHPFRI